MENIVFIQPLHNDPAWTVSDYDWRTVDLQTEMAETDNKIRIIIQDQAPGWVNVDHFFFSDTPWGMREAQWSLDFPDFFGGSVGTGNDYLRLHTGGFDPATGLPTALFGGFDDASGFSTDSGWAYSQNITLDPATNAPADTGLAGVFAGASTARGWVGGAAISTCNIDGAGCRQSLATITSAPFRVTGRYLNFLLTGSTRTGAPDISLDGSEVNPAVEFRLFAGTDDIDMPGEAQLRMSPTICGEDLRGASNGNDEKWHSIDVSAYFGEQLRFQLDDTSIDRVSGHYS